MVFLAHTETGSTGNLARKLGSGDFWLNCRLRSGTNGQDASTCWTKITIPYTFSKRCIFFLFHFRASISQAVISFVFQVATLEECACKPMILNLGASFTLRQRPQPVVQMTGGGKQRAGEGVLCRQESWTKRSHLCDL